MHQRHKDTEPTEEDRRRAKWRLLLNELEIHGCDEFETLVVQFLESGLFDVSKLGPIIDRYGTETQSLEAREKANQFLIKAFWDHRLNDDQLLMMASELPAITMMLDPYVVSDLDIALVDIAGGAAIGQAIVTEWIKAFRTEHHDRVDNDNPFNRPLHKAILAEFASVNAQAQASTTVLDACMHVIDKKGWGTMQEMAMKSATAADFESAIRSMEIDALRRFMRGMIEMRLQRQTYDVHFGTATEHFVDACRAIANNPSLNRLAGLIKRLFATTALASELEAPPSGQVAAPVRAAAIVAVPAAPNP